MWRATLGYSRTALIGAASLGLIVAGLGSASGQEADEPAFSNGQAKATAVVARVAPGVGSLELGISSGVAVTDLKNNVAQAQAETLDLGLIGGVLTAEQCSGSDAVLTPDQLPQASRVDNRSGDAEIFEDEYPISGATIGGGRKHVLATGVPASKAVSEVVATFGSLLTLDAGRAEATTEVIPGEARVARAAVTVDLDIGGIIKLSALRWSATHRTGTDPSAGATFDLGTASLLGVPIPLESLTAVETTLNQVLFYSGVTIEFPKIERFTEPADLIRMTPLRIILRDSPAGKDFLGPVLNLSRVQREQLFDQIAAVYCATAGALLLGDIGVSVASGTGFLKIEIGGAEATSGELVLESPFGDAVAPFEPTVAPPPFRTPVVPPSPVVVPGANRPRPAASTGPVEDHCESTHPLRDTGCAHGALMALGLVGLGATVGVGALDWRHQRRRRAGAEVPT